MTVLIVLVLLVLTVQFGMNAFVLAALVRSKNQSSPAIPAPPKPICGCDHNLAYHDPKTGLCSQRVKHVTKYFNGSATQWKMIDCPCKQYSGPKPVETFFATQTYLES